MKIYVATKFEDKKIAAYWIDRLRKEGIEVTHDWPAAEQDNDLQATAAERKEHAEADFRGVLNADLVWVLAPETGGRGCWTEMGIALGRNIPVILSGAVGKNIFDEFTLNYHHHWLAFEAIRRVCSDRPTIRDLEK